MYDEMLSSITVRSNAQDYLIIHLDCLVYMIDTTGSFLEEAAQAIINVSHVSVLVAGRYVNRQIPSIWHTSSGEVGLLHFPCLVMSCRAAWWSGTNAHSDI